MSGIQEPCCCCCCCCCKFWSCRYLHYQYFLLHFCSWSLNYLSRIESKILLVLFTWWTRVRCCVWRPNAQHQGVRPPNSVSGVFILYNSIIFENFQWACLCGCGIYATFCCLTNPYWNDSRYNFVIVTWCQGDWRVP